MVRKKRNVKVTPSTQPNRLNGRQWTLIHGRNNRATCRACPMFPAPIPRAFGNL